MRVAVGLSWLCFTLVLGALYARIPPNPDQAMFDYIGWVGSQGRVLYVHAGELNWPGEMLLHVVSTGLFGNQIWSWRVFEYLLLILGSLVLLAFCRQAGRPLAGFIVVPLYQGIHTTAAWWLAGQRDVLAMQFLFAAVLFLTMRLKGRSRGWCALSGVLLFYAVLIRPTYLLLGGLAFLADVLARRWSRRSFREVLLDHLTVAGAIAASSVVSMLIAWPSGALREWFNMAVRFNLEVYGGDSLSPIEVLSQFASLCGNSWHWYLAFALGGSVALLRKRGHVTMAGLLILFLTSLGSALAQSKGFGYHFGGILPILSILIAVLIDELFWFWRAEPKSILRAGAILFVAGFSVAGIGKKAWGAMGPQIDVLLGKRSVKEMLALYGTGEPGFTMADVQSVVSFIQDTVPPRSTVLVWGRPVHVNFLAERASPVRFINTYMLEAAKEPFAFAGAWAKELDQAFQDYPPELILAPSRELGPGHLRIFRDEDVSPSVLVLRRALARRYRHERCYGSFDLYRLNSDVPSCPKG